MDKWLHKTQPCVKSAVAFPANDLNRSLWETVRMARPSRLKGEDPSIRLHYIVEWAEARGLKQADVARELGVDKSTTSRWWAGNIPTEKHLVPLAGLLQVEEIAALFRRPEDDWMARFLRGRPREEQDRIKATLETAFPKAGRAA